MPYSSESPEWRLLYELAKLLAPHLARYQPLTRNWQDFTTNKQNEALERNLREFFLLDKVDLGLFDLVSGPNQNLFVFADDMKTKCLAVSRECNTLVTRALSKIHETEPNVPRRVKSDIWKDLKLRELASETFQLVFERFSCKANHRLLLELAALMPGQSTSPELQLFLSTCSDTAESEPWKGVQCTSGTQKFCREQIVDLCYELTSASEQNHKLQLLPQKGQLLSAWTPILSHDSNNHPILKNFASQSLAERITSGMFKRQTVRDLIAQQQGNQHTTVKYTLKAKRALAAELGYCLLDFFDASLDSKDICFFGSLQNHAERDIFYRSFSSQFPSSPEFRLFHIGHPVLLSFAKILLELDDGEAIPLDIRPHYGEENKQAWLQLLSSLDVLQERGARLEDSYTEAIRGCLNVHSQLQNIKPEGTQADITIRNKLYHHIVQHLETALENCAPNLGLKRQHSMNLEIESIMGPMNKRTRTTIEKDADLVHVFDIPGELSDAYRELLPRQADLGKDFPIKSKTFPDTTAGSSKGDAQPPKDRCGFKAAIICALPLEFDAIRSLFDFAWQGHHHHYGKLRGDTNHYVNGRIGDLDVVVLLLSSMGKHQIDTLVLCTCFSSPSLICERCRGVSCDEAGCDEEFLVPRYRLEEKVALEEQGNICEAQKPLIFLGRFGSGDTVLRSSQDRDRLAERLGIAAFEMESAGLWEDLPCIVVKGVCDYADSHKNKEWQDFAAATSASVVKALLERYIITDK
ncbi:hypothetical protein FOC1_g10001676 [Fusarium oxysporum f. sp. cubense race 1]|uniref:DUF7580 domain-containing protein n=1 Tax=Fusarium oxysporum f. sp. cubense (strain race 1) TaxID=1229664 RepID=N4TQ83_FUSC1|nr:hypothetical protein FOC1_g10001676 [Fusarium oxysporum f. sp. cubense race 1]